jgi:hypothetical protein
MSSEAAAGWSMVSLSVAADAATVAWIERRRNPGFRRANIRRAWGAGAASTRSTSSAAFGGAIDAGERGGASVRRLAVGWNLQHLFGGRVHLIRRGERRRVSPP